MIRRLTALETAAVSGGDTPTFNFVNGTAADQQKLYSAINYLKQSPVGAAAFDSNDTVNVRIVHTGAGSDGYDHNTNTIDWDPDSGLTTHDANGNPTGYESAALAFFHEYFHSQDAEWDNPNNQVGFFPDDMLARAGFPDLNEVHAVQVSNAVALQLGEPERTDYRGNDQAISRVDESNGYDTSYNNGEYSYYDSGQADQVIDYFDGLDREQSDGYLSFVDDSRGSTMDYFASDGGGYDYPEPRS